MLMLADLLRQPSAASESPDHPLARLTACHRRVEQRLETLARAGARFSSDRHEALRAIDACLHFFDTNGVLHTADEEESLFPRLLPLLAPAERAVVEGLEQDHETARRLHAELTDASAALHRCPESGAGLAAFRDCVSRLDTLYRRHIGIEDTEVAGLARRLLTGADLVAIGAEMSQRRHLAEVVL